MARFSLLTLVAIALSGVACALPQADQELLGSPVHNSASWHYADCGSPSDVVEIKSLAVTPDPPAPGQNLTVIATGVAKEVIEKGAYADVVVKLGVIKLLTKTFDICEEALKANASIQCPVEKGEYTVEQTVALPKEIPPAKFAINVQAYTKQEQAMLCLDLTVDFSKGRF